LSSKIPADTIIGKSSSKGDKGIIKVHCAKPSLTKFHWISVIRRKDENEDPGSPFIDVEGLSDEDVEPISRTINANKDPLPCTSQSVLERGIKMILKLISDSFIFMYFHRFQV
jgi:hypothetical protein